MLLIKAYKQDQSYSPIMSIQLKNKSSSSIRYNGAQKRPLLKKRASPIY